MTNICFVKCILPFSFAKYAVGNQSKSEISASFLSRKHFYIGLLIYLVFCVTGCSKSCYSANDSSTVAKSYSATSSEDIWNINLGKLELDIEPKHTFKIHNTSASPFKVTSIQKSCGCQTVDISEGTIVEAGKVLNVSYSLPSNVSGPLKGRLAIITDSPDKSLQEIVLNLKAEVPRKIWSSPEAIEFDIGVNEKPQVQELRIESIIPGLLEKYKEVWTSRNTVKVELDQRTDKALIFKLTLLPDVIPDGDSFDYVSISFNDPKQPQLNINVSAKKQARIAAIPKTLILPKMTKDESLTRKIRLMSSIHENFKIVRVENNSNITVDPVPDELHEVVDVTLHISQSEDSQPGKITFHIEPESKISVTLNYSNDFR